MRLGKNLNLMFECEENYLLIKYGIVYTSSLENKNQRINKSNFIKYLRFIYKLFF